jgi:anti-sigma B factor antagonist
MTIHVEKDGTLSRVSIDGELTIYAAAELKPKLLAPLSESAEIEVNLSQVGEMDAAGLQLLILAKREATAKGKALRLVGHSPAALESLDLCDMTGFFGDPVVIPSGAA